MSIIKKIINDANNVKQELSRDIDSLDIFNKELEVCNDNLCYR